ncbi:helix-turn-helix domain-containing protein [Halovenus sp. WSH3]|uniref:Helix-turn-helix domain-containing protein n=1 Tax=Halovenus carboxidivorans TaxID=2692199 RepID=A0A6B0T0C4_9EURY|nr:thiamine-phosphate synthase family protein [Halovenus carboxidivorans]MXR51444.1 helix-turn-helix domain-containing protein [Halovenus carboxidivorans]
MSLQLPSEIVVERFLPTVRAMLAAELNERGLTQQEIADELGVSQAAVSQYVRGDVTVEQRFAEDERLRSAVDRIAAGLATDSMDSYEALGELLAVIRAFEDRGPICAVHEEEMPELAGMGCDLCVRGVDDTVEQERSALAAVRRSARQLANTPGIAELIPNVGTNIGTAIPGATDETDVAAVPGRLQTVGSRVLVPADPEFGASKRVASTILAAMSIEPDLRGAINLATVDAVLDAARELGYEPMVFDAAYENRESRLREAFRQRGSVPRVIYHEGAFGIEPITYVFGETATEATARLLELQEQIDS